MNRLFEVMSRPEPTIAAPITGPLSTATIDEIAQIVDVAEFRADLFESHNFEYLLSQSERLSSMPLLLTLRNSNEGGGWRATEEDRINLLDTMLPHFDGVDIEILSGSMERVVEMGHEIGKIVVASTHDFSVTPADSVLEERLEMAKSAKADFIKFAVKTDSEDEYERLKSFTIKHADDNVIVVAMGAFGSRSRIELPGNGSKLTFAFAGDGAIAPGQLSFIKTHQRLRKKYKDYDALFSTKASESQ